MMIRCDQAPAVVQGQRQQVHVGQLARAVDVGVVEVPAIEQADVVGPELVKTRGRGLRQHGREYGQGLRVGVTRLAHDAQATVLPQRATGPALFDMRLQPAGGFGVMDVVAVVQGNQHVDVEQRPHVRRPLRRAGGRCVRC